MQENHCLCVFIRKGGKKCNFQGGGGGGVCVWRV